jgi:hypothetical protein
MVLNWLLIAPSPCVLHPAFGGIPKRRGASFYIVMYVVFITNSYLMFLRNHFVLQFLNHETKLLPGVSQWVSLRTHGERRRCIERSRNRLGTEGGKTCSRRFAVGELANPRRTQGLGAEGDYFITFNPTAQCIHLLSSQYFLFKCNSACVCPASCASHPHVFHPRTMPFASAGNSRSKFNACSFNAGLPCVFPYRNITGATTLMTKVFAVVAPSRFTLFGECDAK